MATKKKLLQAAAGSAGGAGGLDIPDVFSTYLYSGNSSAQTITNGIDLDGEGGLWWLKRRTGTGSHALYDSTRATGSEHFPLFSNSNIAEYDDFDTTPTSTGFTINSTSSGTVNETGQDYVSWTWRKAPKFFDCVTWTGDGVAGRTISHNLNNEVGMIIVKRTNGSFDWICQHRSLSAGYVLYLNQTSAQDNNPGAFTTTLPTSSVFSVGGNNKTNESGGEYVAYLFAHNDSDGEFGPDSDQDIIRCGSYTGNGSNTGPIIDLGFEPQWLMIKSADTAKEWRIHDTMRGLATNSSNPFIYANTTSQETNDTGPVNLLANGFQLSQGGSETNNNGTNYIYMAIRGGQLAPPEAGTEVFAIDTRTAVSSISGTDASFYAGFAPDMALWRTVDTSANNLIAARLIQSKLLYANLTNVESSSTNGAYYFDKENGWFSLTSSDADSYSWMWKRAPGFFDVVAWDTENTANRRLEHNLTVTPEMAWVKSRDYVDGWYVYHSGIGSNGFLSLNENDDNTVTSAMWPSPSATEFGIRENAIWNAGTAMIGYFFATLAGISKVGSYTGNGSNQTISCGFTSGASFILIKRTDANGNWVIFDSTRGIVSGNSPYILLNDNQAENANIDVVDPDSSGFVVNQETTNNLNVNGGNYIFYAIA